MPDEKPAPPRRRRGFFRDPLHILLACIIAISLILAGLIGAELYARHVVNNKVAQAVACELKDQTTVSFAATPLLLWQLATKHFTNISVSTAGNQIGDSKGMKINVNVRDVRLEPTGDSAGTVGAIDGVMTWTADGIRQSVQNASPVLGPFVTNSVVTHPADGTIEFKGMLDNIAAKPVVSGNELRLEIVSFNALGFTLPKESAQTALDTLTSNLIKTYPLGIRPDSVQVTPTGVEGRFSTRNAPIPTGGQSPCFAHL